MIQWIQDKILNVNSDIYMYTSSFFLIQNLKKLKRPKFQSGVKFNPFKTSLNF